MITMLKLPEFNNSTTVADLKKMRIALNTMKCTITPEIAQDLIDNMSPNQRKLNLKTVRKYETIMREGYWKSYTLDGIAIGSDGLVLNGQHRLHAVILSGIPWDANVEFNVDPILFQFMDQARKRETKDFLDCPNADLVSALGKRMYAMEKGSTPLLSVIQSKITPIDNVPDTLNTAYCESNEPYLQSLVASGRKMYSAIGARGGKTIFSFFGGLLLYCGFDPQYFINDFCKDVPTSTSVTACKTAIMKKKKPASKDILGYLLMAYDYFERGEDLKSINKTSSYIEKYNQIMLDTREREKAAPTA